MKKFIYILALAALAVSCKSGEIERISIEGSPVKFGAAGAVTKLTVAPTGDAFVYNWSVSDKVGIYAVKDGKTFGCNYLYTVTPDEADARRASLSGGNASFQFKWAEAAQYTFCAYAPFSGTPGDGNDYAIPVSLPVEQSQAEANVNSQLAGYAVLASSPVQSSPTSGEISLPFRNLLSTACIKLGYNGSTSRVNKIKRAVLSGNKLSFKAGFILVDKILEGESDACLSIVQSADSVALNIAHPFDLSDGAATLWFAIAPGSQSEGLTLTLYTEDAYKAVISLDPVQFEPNTVHVKDLKFSPSLFKYTGKVDPIFAWVPATTLAELQTGECFIAYYNSVDNDTFVLNKTSIGRNPSAEALSTVATKDDDGNITDIPAIYKWNMETNGTGYAFRYESGSGNLVSLYGCNQAQGVAIVASASAGHYASTATYGDVWTFTEKEGGFSVNNPSAGNRYLVKYEGTTQWRMSGANNGAVMIYYRKQIN